jgi:hypothetical protein
VGDGEFRSDPSAPVFFLSYNRSKSINRQSSPFEPNRRVRQFFHDLTDGVGELVGLLPGQDAGFMDVTMEGGQVWTRRLLRAVGTCQVFVALLSTGYLNSSPWGAMEWDLFRRRKALIRTTGEPADEDTGIIPVIWAPTQTSAPKRVSRVQRFQPWDDLSNISFQSQYERDGLYGLIHTNPAGYDAVVWKLAMYIQKLQHEFWVEPDVRTTVKGLSRTFGQRTPRAEGGGR